MSEDFENVLGAIGPRLKKLRRDAGLTLAQLCDATGISVSTLSRLESGRRQPTLELLLPLAKAYHTPLDDIVDSPATEDPRVFPKPTTHGGTTVIPLTRKPGGLQAYKQILRPNQGDLVPEMRSHEGYHWLYVLNGRLRLLLGDKDLTLKAGEVAEFDTHLPHWFGNADTNAVEYLSILGPQGERFHIRARYQP